MKNFQIILILFTVSILVLNSCKKGEDDPFLSLRSRDARITGEWLISDISGSSTKSTLNHGDNAMFISQSIVTNHSFSGFIWSKTISTTTVTSEETNVDTFVDAQYFNEQMSIEKDGTVIFTITDEQGYQISYSGNWFWVDGKKNKVGITFYVDGSYITFNIRQLKDKELVLEVVDQNSTSNSYSTVTEKSEILQTYEKQK